MGHSLSKDEPKYVMGRVINRCVHRCQIKSSGIVLRVLRRVEYFKAHSEYELNAHSISSGVSSIDQV